MSQGEHRATAPTPQVDVPAARHRRPPSPWRRLRRYVAGGVTSALVSTLGLATCEYRRLDGNITSLPLYGGVGGDAGTQKPDRFGNTPIDVLVIGSDTRGTTAGAKAANADVELLVHVAADRSNATVLSIPRDTVTDLPACRDAVTRRVTPARRGQINSTLAHGPGCTVAAVHALTGITVGHFAMLDFSAVVTMSNAVGGVPVCVSDDVYDPYSHLKLRRGHHVLKGVAALQFVRSRHAFGDGSDIGRTHAQHLFLSSMIRTMKSAGTIADPRRLLAVADAATKALTVDTGLGSIGDLVGLATDLDKVPPGRITFVTMPTQPDPSDPNRVVPAASAASIFAAVAADQPLTRTRRPPKPSGSSPTRPALAALAAVPVTVANATGRTGRAGEVAAALRTAGPARVSTATQATAATSGVRHAEGQAAAARTLAAHLGLPPSAVGPGGAGTGLTVVVGLDWTRGTTFTAAPVDDAALAGGNARTAEEAKDCARVSRARTVALRGVPLTPQEAYHRSPSVPDSAP